MNADPPTVDPSAPLAPVADSQRIDSLDVLRGFALLGILVMNIQSFSMPIAAYSNPTAYGDLNGVNYLVWYVSHVLFDQKFMALFSALFGAGIVLMAQRAEAKGRKATALHYRRTLWLVVFGAVHAYMVWVGDVLLLYGVCSLWVFWFKNRSPRTLAIVGAVVVLVSPLLSLMGGLSMSQWSPEQLEPMAAGWQPSPEAIAVELEAYRGGFLDQLRYRVPQALAFQVGAFLFWGLWRAGGVMLLGMALFKVGFFGAGLPDRVYRNCIVAAVVVGIPLTAYGVHANFAAAWGVSRMLLGGLYNYAGSLIVSLGYAAAIMLLCKHRRLVAVTGALSNVGRMALSNYLLQSVLATAIFYGHGLGLFGRVSRGGQVLVVLGIWAVQIPFSAWWLRRFRFGPFEWLWRTLAYMKLQPMAR